MKKIAVFLDNTANHSIYSRISGVFNSITGDSERIGLYLFRSRGALGLDERYNIGEYNIFRLPRLDDFDGFIFDLFNLSYDRESWYGARVCWELIDAVKASGKPAISIGNRIEGMHHTGIDNEISMTAMIRHMWEVHLSRSFWFIMGPEDHWENRLRAKAVLKYLSDRSDTDYSQFFYYESYRYSCGEHGFKVLFERFGSLPDAIICANDEIAIGVCQTAASMGFSCPRDFLVTGFDNIEMAGCYTPPLTTIDQRWAENGQSCMDYFKACWYGHGEDYPETTPVYTQMIRRKSCGCSEPVYDVEEMLNRRVVQDLELERFNHELNVMEYRMLACDSLFDIGEVFLSIVPQLRCKNVHLVLDRRFYSRRQQTSLLRKSVHPAEENGEGEDFFLVEGYPPQMTLAFSCGENGFFCGDRTIESLFPDLEADGDVTDFMFIPVHYKERAVGYIVLHGSEHIIKNHYLARAIQTLIGAIENCYIRSRLQGANELLSRSSVTDAMTGFYNRMGYQEMACRYFDEKKAAGKALTILFADMDHMKEINDRFGHKSGDYAILSIVQAIKRSCPDNCPVVRMGGDEFLIILDETDEARVKELILRIKNEIPRTEAVTHLPYAPTLSVGFCVTEPKSDKTLDDYVRESDELMYREKRQGRGQ